MSNYLYISLTSLSLWVFTIFWRNMRKLALKWFQKPTFTHYILKKCQFPKKKYEKCWNSYLHLVSFLICYYFPVIGSLLGESNKHTYKLTEDIDSAERLDLLLFCQLSQGWFSVVRGIKLRRQNHARTRLPSISESFVASLFRIKW